MTAPVRATPRNPLCVALDLGDPDEVAALAAAVAPYAAVLKVGLTAFTAGGADLVARVRRQGSVFLDLKLHDIPNQVHGVVDVAADLGVDYTTVHATGGARMIERAVEAADGRLTILAVTVLTSLDDADLARMDVAVGAEDHVRHLAELALTSGATGLVCSARELQALRTEFGAYREGGPLLVVPGIRPGSSGDDQKRTMGARDALDAGADLLVVGRPISGSPDPAASARSLVDELRA